ncbi:MAG: sodium:solute symporter family protein [Candidatus Acetothermia bacterium]|nr:sodium:solute symporter family protein [Candidatus Acetothermia bacterium]
MWEKSLVVGGYLAVLAGIGLWARRRARRSLEDYFVASRTLSPWVLFLTMAATNFSAFTVFGFSGAGWRIGYAFYPIMAFGTGFMAISFYFIGFPVWRLGREKGLLTPPELVFDRFRSPTLRLLFLAVMAVFTLPYLAMQPMAAGYALEELLGLPYFAGAALVTAVVLFYTFLGGMRGVAWTDVVQGGMMLVLLLVALGVVAAPFGGLSAANRAAASAWPGLFSRPGLGGAFPPGIWFGYMLLWLLCDPMFPQLFQRFYAARDERALSTTMLLYPLVTGILFLLPVAIGVVGRLAFPELPSGIASDRILPLLLSRYAPPVLEALVLAAALAALMSTLDSQLLTLSSMLTRDLWEPLTKRPASPWLGKLFVVGLALAGLAIAWRPPATFLEIATEAFTGLAVLFPTVVAALYWRRATAPGAIASILVGEGLVVAYRFRLLPGFGTLPVVPIVAVASLVLVGMGLLTPPRPCAGREKGRVRWGWGLGFVLLFLLGNDFWAWGDRSPGPLGFPWWVWYFLGLGVVTALAFRLFSQGRPTAHAGLRTGSSVPGPRGPRQDGLSP